MSFSTWMYSVAIIGLILSGSVQAQQQDNESGQDAPNEQAATDDLPFALPVIIIESQESAKSRQSEESERNKREKDDLVAQQGMNAATQAMNEATQSMKWASWVSTGFVGIGTLLLTWTLLVTRTANKAAQAAVAVTRVIGEAQVRAYLGFDIKSGTVERYKPVTFDVQIKNYGASPALKAAAKSNVVVRPYDWKWSDEWPAQVTLGVRSPVTIHPHGIVSSTMGTDPPAPLSAAQYDAIKSGMACIYGIFTVEFHDVFTVTKGKIRSEEFCFEFSGAECFERKAPRLVVANGDDRQD